MCQSLLSFGEVSGDCAGFGRAVLRNSVGRNPASGCQFPLGPCSALYSALCAMDGKPPSRASKRDERGAAILDGAGGSLEALAGVR